MSWRRYRPTSHEAFSHADIDSLGYDWGRAANPHVAPKRPLKVYFPRTTEDIVTIVREMKQLRAREPTPLHDTGSSRLETPFLIRGKGHSSNDLVLADGGIVLSTDYLNRILEVTGRTVKVQSGVILAELDAYLGRLGYGLPVIGDHDHITAGGFASVGGVSPASHRWGLFVDNVEELAYVNWDGEHISCSREKNATDFYRVLAGTGQYGVIATLTCKIIPIEKLTTVLKNERTITRDVERFLRVSACIVSDPGDAVMERGVWLDVPMMGKPFVIGQVSVYRKTSQTWLKSLRNRAAHGFLHGLGYLAGRLPRLIDLLFMYAGVIGIIVSPRYASIKNIEVFIDKILDSSVGDPSRMLIVLAPAEQYAIMFRELYELCRRYRATQSCFTFLSFYVKGIKSAYLSPDESQRFGELVLWLGIRPENLPDKLLETIVSEIDDLCRAHRAFRYMHTRTVKDERRLLIDPNAFFYGPLAEQARAAWRRQSAGGR